jgi:predicted ATPase
LTLAEEQAFPVWFAAGTILAGWAEARLGQWDSGAARIRRGIAAYLANGAAMMHPYFLGLLAEALDAGGQIDEGLEVLSRALSIVDETGEQFYEAELHRLRGELLLKQSGRDDRTDAALMCFRTALTLARRQRALSLELRASISLARFEHSHGSHPFGEASAGANLELVCGLLTEGFSTADWHDAAALRSPDSYIAGGQPSSSG